MPAFSIQKQRSKPMTDLRVRPQAPDADGRVINITPESAN